MSLIIFIAFCILGIDFMVFVLLQWVFGERKSVRAQLVNAHKPTAKVISLKSYLINSRAVQDGRENTLEVIT